MSDKRFVPYVMVVGDWGGPNKGKISTLARESFIAYHKKINEILFPEKNSHDSPFKNLPVCYASKPNSLAIRANGRVAKCTVHLKDDRNTVGLLSPDGRIKLDDEKMMLWMRGLKTGGGISPSLSGKENASVKEQRGWRNSHFTNNLVS